MARRRQRRQRALRRCGACLAALACSVLLCHLLVSADIPSGLCEVDGASCPLVASEDAFFLIDTSIPPDNWDPQGTGPRVPTNGDPPEQLVKVTDRKHRFPVFATVCSLAFLGTIITIIIVCIH